MTLEQWTAFSKFKTEFKAFCNSSKHFNENVHLSNLQKQISKDANIPEYSLETNIVYNESVENFTQKSEIKAILVADNPGKNEQLAKNRTYLIGQAGKLAENFFTKNLSLNIDFRKNVVVLNKSPLHTAKTILLKRLLLAFENETNSKDLRTFFNHSQQFMAKSAFQLQKLFDCDLLIVGYGELGEKKIFEEYWKTLKNLYTNDNEKRLLCFQHFSMNRFTIDLKQNYDNTLSLSENLKVLGAKHRKRIFGF